MHNKISKSSSERVGAYSKLLPTVVLIIFLSFSSLMFAQPGFDDDVDDEVPAAAIDTNILLLCVAGAALGIYFLTKKEKLVSSQK